MADARSCSSRIWRARLRSHQTRDPISSIGSALNNPVVARKAMRVSSARPVKHTEQAAASCGTSRTAVEVTATRASFIRITDTP
jgi:hypothetical protein